MSSFFISMAQNIKSIEESKDTFCLLLRSNEILISLLINMHLEIPCLITSNIYNALLTAILILI
jgi:hypothetical protein